MCVHGYWQVFGKTNFPVDDYLDRVPPPRIVDNRDELKEELCSAMEAMSVNR